MFGKLSREKHDRDATRDHNKIIREAADDVVELEPADDGSDDSISLEDLDEVIGDDSDTVSQQDVDELEALVGQVAEKEGTDIAKMTQEEIAQQVKSVDAPSLTELND